MTARRWEHNAAYAVALFAAATGVLFVRVLKPTSFLATVLLVAWLSVPYVILAAITALAKTRTAALASLIVTVLVAVGGVGLLTAIIFVYPDPQGGIGVVFTPAYQIIAIAVLFPICRWLV